MKKLASIVLAGLVFSTNAFATKYTLTNGNFGIQTSSISFADGDIIEIPASANNVSFTTTQTINKAVTLDVRGQLKMTPGNKILTIGSGSVANVYNGGSISGSNASQQLVIGTNNVFNGSSSVNSTGATMTANDISMGFSSGSTPLPIRLLSFDAATQGSKVSISWTAVNDREETSVFTIELSIDGKNWEAVATVNSKGEAHQTVSYTHELVAPKSVKTAIYRVRFEAADGQEAYSAARSINITSTTEVSAAVTTAGSDIRVQVKGLTNETSTVFVSTMDGRIIYSQAVSATTDAVSVPTSTPGMYIITVTDNNSFRISHKIVMQ